MIINHERYRAATRRYEELAAWVEVQAKPIIARRYPKHRAWVKEFDEGSVTLEFNDSCHCHPSYHELRFPAAWLFDPEWEKRVDEELMREQAAKDAVERRNQAIREKREQADYLRLKAKYELNT